MFIIDEMRVDNNMNTTNLEFINIYGLFGRYDIEISFDKEVNIYIGENGLGKTTILNCIYFILEKKFSNLNNISFSEIYVKFKNETEEHRITSFDVSKYNQKRRGGRPRFMDEEYFEYVLDNLNFKAIDSFEVQNEFDIDIISRKIARQMEIPISVARRQLFQYIETKELPNKSNIKKGDDKKIEALIRSISKNITERIVYLPTYRRIEDDFNKLNLSIDELNKSDLLIRFGMSDVQNSIDKILDKIRTVAMKGFTEMTGVLLKQYSDGGDIINKDNRLLYNIDLETAKIVLDRIGVEIEEEYRKKILDLIENREIYHYDYLYLLNLIGKLISNYDLQKQYDDRIKRFAQTCNKYLNNKRFYYNQSTLTLEVYLENNNEFNRTLKLTQLSSGEKQIVSLFSKMYLEDNDKYDKCIVIIDEPELSLSLNWQKMLLPDIMRSENCKLLLTVTHSPFIFENEFDYDAKDIKKYMKMYK